VLREITWGILLVTVHRADQTLYCLPMEFWFHKKVDCTSREFCCFTSSIKASMVLFRVRLKEAFLLLSFIKDCIINLKLIFIPFIILPSSLRKWI
jgi:hypothetical protein